MRNLLQLSIVAVVLSGCSISLPVAVITPSGDVLHGVNTASMSSGEFNISGMAAGKPLSCHQGHQS